MDRNVQRINGSVTHLHRLTDTELENMMGYTHERIEQATADLDTLGIESARRFAAAEVAGPLATVHQLYPGQLELDITPPPAA